MWVNMWDMYYNSLEIHVHVGQHVGHVLQLIRDIYMWDMYYNSFIHVGQHVGHGDKEKVQSRITPSDVDVWLFFLFTLIHVKNKLHTIIKR